MNMSYAMKKETANAETVFGIDVSRHQGNIDWKRVSNAGARFVFMKATEGATWVDPKFYTNWHQAKTNGIIRGVYHFFRPHSPVDGKVDNLVSTVGALEAGDLPPVLDIEVPESWRSLSLARRVKIVQDWLDGVEQGLGIKPIIYLSPSFADEILENTGQFDSYLLWLAHYTSRPQPRTPKPWADWTFWQYSETGRVDGISGNVDMNRFNGSIDDLIQLTVQSSALCNCKCTCCADCASNK